MLRLWSAHILLCQAKYSTTAVVGITVPTAPEGVYTFSLTASYGSTVAEPVPNTAASVTFRKKAVRSVETRKVAVPISSSAAPSGKAQLLKQK